MKKKLTRAKSKSNTVRKTGKSRASRLKTSTNKRKHTVATSRHKTADRNQRKRLSISKVTKRRPISPRASAAKEIVIRRSSGRKEKFDTNRLAQTVSRSGVPYLMAMDIAKKATKKIKSQVTPLPRAVRPRQVRNVRGQKKSKRKSMTEGGATPKPVVVSASQVRNLVTRKLQDRNRPDIANSYSGNPPEHYDLQAKPTLDEKEPVLDIVAANMNKILHDRSKGNRNT